MKNNKGSDILWQEAKTESSNIFADMMRQVVQRAMVAMMEHEADMLCGAAYEPIEGGAYRRGGSEKGRFYFEGEAHPVIRPRVKSKSVDGVYHEHRLNSYQAGRSRECLTPQIMRMIEAGASLRGIGRMKRRGFSASTAQKILVEESAKAVGILRGRSLSGEEFFGIMVDGVHLADDCTVVVAIGFCVDGSKKVLDFAVGNSESYEVSRELMARLLKRGFKSVTSSLLAVIDGGKGLRKAILEMFPDAQIQRCWVHKERNLHAHLSWKDQSECSRLIDKIRKAQGKDDGEAAYADLRDFLASKNKLALASLDEAADDLLTFHRLNVPATLNIAFLSTNTIENVMRNFRRHTDRVTRWDPKTDQADRWTAMALLLAEEGFKKIRNYKDLPPLLAALGGMAVAVAPDCVPVEANPSGSSTTSTPSGAKAEGKENLKD